MRTEDEIITSTSSPEACPSDDHESALEAQNNVKASLSPDRFELLRRTLKVRRLIGKVSPDVAELVRDMREQGA